MQLAITHFPPFLKYNVECQLGSSSAAAQIMPASWPLSRLDILFSHQLEIFEHTCAYARRAVIPCFLSACLSVRL